MKTPFSFLLSSSTVLAGLGAAEGAVVFIDLPDQEITRTNADSFQFDSGSATLVGGESFVGSASSGASFALIGVDYGTMRAGAVNYTGTMARVVAYVLSQSNDSTAPDASAEFTDYFSVTFTQNDVNGGMETNGIIEMTAFAAVLEENRLTFGNLFYDDADANADYDSLVAGARAIPEPSGLALLALGAGGLMLRRRREAKA